MDMVVTDLAVMGTPVMGTQVIGSPVMSAAGVKVDAPATGPVLQPADGGDALGREVYASFLLLAVTAFTLAGYVGLALLLVGAVH